MSTTTAPMLSVYPGAPNVPPPEGYDELKVPPAQMRDGDRLLLAGRIRSVWRPVFDDAGTIKVVMLYANEDGSGVDEWHPRTGPLPIAIWRASRDAPRTASITEGRPDEKLPTAASLSTSPTLGSDLINGLRAIPKLPEKQDTLPRWSETAHFDGFQRARREPESVPAHTARGKTDMVLTALADARRTLAEDRTAAGRR